MTKTDWGLLLWLSWRLLRSLRREQRNFKDDARNDKVIWPLAMTGQPIELGIASLVELGSKVLSSTTLAMTE